MLKGPMGIYSPTAHKVETYILEESTFTLRPPDDRLSRGKADQKLIAFYIICLKYKYLLQIAMTLHIIISAMIIKNISNLQVIYDYIIIHYI